MQCIPPPGPTAKLNNLLLEGKKYGGPMETKEETELRGDVPIVSMPPFTANPPPEAILDPALRAPGVDLPRFMLMP
jgi:hypothetical protein